MNILFITDYYPNFGGIERVTDTLIDYLGEYHSCYSLSRKATEGAVVPKHLKKYFVFSNESTENQINEYNSLIESLHIDIVINQGIFPNNSPIIFNGRRNMNVKVISVLHGMPGYEKSEYLYFREQRKESSVKKGIRKLIIKSGLHGGYNKVCKRYRKAYHEAAEYGDRIVLLSKAYIKPFTDEYSLQQYLSKICAISNPLPSPRNVITAPLWSDKENMILFVGRLSPEKRVDIILTIWSRLCKTKALGDIMQSWKLVIVGDGPARTHLENIANENNLKNCIFTGSSTKVNEYYSKAKILLLTSLFEGLPMCLLEAQKFGCVPVSFDISGGVRDILDNGSGILVRQDDIEGMTAKVAELIADDSLLQDLSEKAVSNTSRFSLDKIGQMWDDLISTTCR